MNLIRPRDKSESGQPSGEGEACHRPCNNEHERSDSPGWLRTAGIDRNVRNLRDLIWSRVSAGAEIAKRRRKYITDDVPDQESEGVVVAMSLGNSRGAKDPCQ